MYVYEMVTNKIIEKLEQGTIPWRKTWKVKIPINFFTQRPYNGINKLLLGLNDYPCPFYATFKQISDSGMTIKEGEKAHQVYFVTVNHFSPPFGK